MGLGLAVMLMKDVFKSGKGKLRDIRHYYPEADAEDWTLIPAGVRAQIIKKDPKRAKVCFNSALRSYPTRKELLLVSLERHQVRPRACRSHLTLLRSALKSAAKETLSSSMTGCQRFKRWSRAGALTQRLTSWKKRKSSRSTIALAAR